MIHKNFHFIHIFRESTDEAGEAAAASGLGEVYQAMGQHDTALEYHMLDMEIGQRTGASFLFLVTTTSKRTCFGQQQ